MKTLCLLLCFFFLFGAVLSLKNHEKHRCKIVLHNGVIDTESVQVDLAAFSDSNDEPKQYYIQLQPPISHKIKSLLKRKLKAKSKAIYIPHHTFILIAKPSDVKKLYYKNGNKLKADQEPFFPGKKEQNNLLVRWVNEVAPIQKLSQKLKRFMDNPALKKIKKTVLLDVEILPIKGTTTELVMKQLKEKIASLFPELQEPNDNFSIKLELVSKNKILIHFNMNFKKPVRAANFHRLVSWLGTHVAVLHIQFREKFRTLEGESVMSEMTEPLEKEGFYETHILNKAIPFYQNLKADACVGQKNMPDVQFLHSKGLNGSSEILAIADTGIDYSHCMFYDPKYPKPPFDRVDKNSHRKIVAYWTHADDKDTVKGHGTHITGIAVGNCGRTPHFNGVLPEAKVAFMDIGGDSGFLAVPWNLEKGYFDKFYGAGARISSNSWGNQRLGQYTQAAREIDHFTFKHRDFLPLFAAGNGGRSGSRTLTPPGTAKNCLTTGSSQGSYDAFKLAYPLYADLLKDQFRHRFCSNENTNPMVSAACPGLKSPSLKACCESPFLQKYCCLRSIYQTMKTHPERYSEKNMATFSSRGPTADGRIKPDLVTPGQPIFSARSDGTSDDPDHLPIPLVMQGTSQSTPIMAGYAMMARQYFMKGFYPTGNPVKTHGFEPSGALLKAVLINSGEELTGMVEWDGDGDWRKLEKGPNPVQGFGKARPAKALKFKESNFELFKGEDSLTTGEEKMYCFKRRSDGKNGQFKTTLVWMDYPGHPSAKIALVNDLDLEVHASVNGEKKVLLGNGGPKKDFLNNVERVVIPEENIDPQEKIVVKVKGANIPHGPQFFALVATGNFVTTEC